MVSLPEPVVIVFAKAEPVTTTAVVKALASRFSKLVTLTVSPVVWSEPAATAKLTALRLAPAATISVSVPVLPSIDISEPRY